MVSHFDSDPLGGLQEGEMEGKRRGRGEGEGGTEGRGGEQRDRMNMRKMSGVGKVERGYCDEWGVRAKKQVRE